VEDHDGKIMVDIVGLMAATFLKMQKYQFKIRNNQNEIKEEIDNLKSKLFVVSTKVKRCLESKSSLIIPNSTADLLMDHLSDDDKNAIECQRKPLKLYNYQQKAVEKFRGDNIIVVLGTGMGKTLIAVKAIEHVMRTKQSAKIMFVVPNNSLLEQQANYVRKHLTLKDGEQVTISTLAAELTYRFDNNQWEEVVSVSDVMMGTPQVFYDAVSYG